MACRCLGSENITQQNERLEWEGHSFEIHQSMAVELIDKSRDVNTTKE